MPTPVPEAEPTARMESDSPRPMRANGSEAQFAPGTIIAGRYRISSILGSGGMGEVYRADDIKLGQQVALKFLPARLARDPVLLARLHDEVRLGRQIAHPNVCRIYDIIDWEGAHFVSMEYVDGEDLARLLRRIGRLAHDKAVDIARGIAAGLHAAHAKGILHRDLKPANIMIDSHGEARIMDFGLALAAGEDDGTISGTPAYMAPEQLTGQPATIQSDLYAHGLVMYELFTGKRAHSARSLIERKRELTSEITTPSSVIKDIDPAIERLILRCLAADQAQRPRSVREVVDALPGGDPLATALAAGETPSPRMVAAAGSEGSLRPVVAVALLAAAVLQIGALLALAWYGKSIQAAGVNRPPVVLAERGRALLRELGIPAQPFTTNGFEAKTNRLVWVDKNDHAPRRWKRAQRGLPFVTFWLREEPEPLLNEDVLGDGRTWTQVPPQSKPGSIVAELDSSGRLVSLLAIASPVWKPRANDWNAMLDAAGWKGLALTPTVPRLLPPSYADARAAWTARHPGDGTEIRIEAASLRGVPVFLRVLGPWDEPGKNLEETFGRSFGLFLGTLVAIAATLGVFLAWRNLRLRRGDRTAAIRIGAALFVLNVVAFVLAADHELAVLHEIGIVVTALAKGLLWASLFCLVYLALEPYVRRRWPDRLISWSRLVRGNWRDPMVGRDVLIGIIGGIGHVTVIAIANLVAEHADTGAWDVPPEEYAISWLAGSFSGLTHLAGSAARGIVFGMTMMILLMLLSIVLRRRALAVAGFFLLNLMQFAFSGATQMSNWPFFIMIATIVTVVLARYGLLAAVVFWTTFFGIFLFPILDGIAWYTARTLVVPLFFLALALWAFRISLGGQKLFVMDEIV